ncbi:MAG: hypothetical protein K5695_11730 [Oscillospiraceae bacterium]|nr:hypothetical protein [Oscillospiraceae bacterium]
MRFKRPIAFTAALLVLAGGIGSYSDSLHDKALRSYANQFGDINGDGEVNASDATLILSYSAYRGTGGDLTLEAWLRGNGYEPEIMTEEPTDTTETSTDETDLTDGSEEMTEAAEIDLENSNDTLTVLGWNIDQVQYTDHYAAHYAELGIDVDFKAIAYIGYEMPEQLQTYVNGGEDADLFMVEPDWMWQVAGDDGLAMPLSELGITEADYADAYPYAVEIGKDQNGELMAAAADICPGFYAYNADLAAEYLGVSTPEEMQAKVCDWQTFEATAEELKQASGGSVTITATIDGMWKAFSTNTDYSWVNDGNIVTDQAEVFLNIARRFSGNGYVDPELNQWTDDWFDLSQSDDTMGFFYSSWTLYPSGSYAYPSGNWKIVKGPDAFFWGGNWFCAASTCNSKAAAADFLRTFTIDKDRMQDFMLEQSDLFGDGYFISNNQKVIAALEGSSDLLGGQDPLPVMDEVAKSIRWDSTKASPYDLDIRSQFPFSYSIRYDEPDDELIQFYKDCVHCSYEELQ